MKLYEGKEPCPGCGRTGIEVPRTYKSGLCYDCEQNLKLGKQIAFCARFKLARLKKLILALFTMPLLCETMEMKTRSRNEIHTLS